MTLKEIEKIIDEADFFWAMNGDDKRAVTLPKEQEYRNFIKKSVKQYIEHGWKLVFFKLSDVGFVTKTWFVDCIDKEKKVVRKKLDDMTPDELYQLEVKYPCKGSPSCFDCPLNDSVTHACLIHFAYCKKVYENNKDKEFEIEVEVGK